MARYRDLTYQTLLSSLPRKEPREYLYGLIEDHVAQVGKGFRPALCIASCRAFGGSIEQALHSAVAIELLHNGFLVHDDIEDGSLYRRNHPTMHVAYGVPVAVNVGDLMNALSIGPLIDNLRVLGSELAGRVFYEVHRMVVQTVEGQAIELGWTRDNVTDIDVDDYLRLVLKKTGWYTCICPARVGALIGTGGRIDPDRFNKFGFLLGAAFQIQDDILNLVGNQREYGKEILGDIWEGKRTLMLIETLARCTAGERQRLLSILTVPRSRRVEREVQWVFDLMDRCGAIEFARAVSRELLAEAEREFDLAYADAPESEDKAFIRGLIVSLDERKS